MTSYGFKTNHIHVPCRASWAHKTRKSKQTILAKPGCRWYHSLFTIKNWVTMVTFHVYRHTAMFRESELSSPVSSKCYLVNIYVKFLSGTWRNLKTSLKLLFSILFILSVLKNRLPVFAGRPFLRPRNSQEWHTQNQISPSNNFSTGKCVKSLHTERLLQRWSLQSKIHMYYIHPIWFIRNPKKYQY